uniref:Uncharacterized protein n=1 Tax=Rhizophora mucronata TaxID=61149 RepID=A0A2P2JWG9_RHIMU
MTTGKINPFSKSTTFIQKDHKPLLGPPKKPTKMLIVII